MANSIEFCKQDNNYISNRLLKVIEQDILPLTKVEVAKGNKVFGAAILDKNSGDLVVADTNGEHTEDCPLWHGEMMAIRKFFALKNRPKEEDCVLLSTHEPCSMCASAIAWCGFNLVYFLFDYDDTKEQFSIPHDIQILQSLFSPSKKLNHENKYYQAIPMRTLPLDQTRLDKIIKQYDELSNLYQEHKENTAIPLK